MSMRRSWVARLAGILVFVIIAVAVFGQVVHQLWNVLMPDIFGLKPLSFWLRGVRPRGMWGSRHRMGERWARMSPEERDEFRRGMSRGRYGRRCAPPDQTGV